MIAIALSLSIYLAFVLFLHAALGWGVIVSLFVSLLPGLAAFALIGRVASKKLKTLIDTTTNQAKKGNLDKAVQTLKADQSLKRLHPLVSGQINAYLGMLLYLRKDYDEAAKYLKKVRVAHWSPKVMLAMVYYRRRQMAKMEQSFKRTLRFYRKEPFIYAIYAWALQKAGQREKAASVLEGGIKTLAKDERLSRALENVKQGKPIKMSRYGEVWYQFGFERPPAQPHPSFRRKPNP